MAGFSGFTEEEIRRFKAQGDVVNQDGAERREAVKKASLSTNKSGKRSKPREKIRTKPSSGASPKSKNNATTVRNCETSTSPTAKVETAGKHVEDRAKNEEEKNDCEKPHEVEVIMEPERIKEIELSNLEKMQQKQKEMEKINKKKEKMLQQTLKERYKKTKKETETLKLVQKELSHLDHLLSGDVEILREKIDEACREYDYAQKRYERAESEFINAKVDLHTKSETKDQLTEHLCSIIQENEKRKAEKLAELMSKLELAEQDLKEPVCDGDDEADVKQESIAKNIEDVDKTTEDGAQKSPNVPDEKPTTDEGTCLQTNENLAPDPTENKTETLAESKSKADLKDNNNCTSVASDIKTSHNDSPKTVQPGPINR